VSDPLWDDVRQWFDLVDNGSAPDVIVAETTLAHSQRLLDLIRSPWIVVRIPARWRRQEETVADFTAAG
jgi:hypothetical protein